MPDLICRIKCTPGTDLYHIKDIQKAQSDSQIGNPPIPSHRIHLENTLEEHFGSLVLVLILALALFPALIFPPHLVSLEGFLIFIG